MNRLLVSLSLVVLLASTSRGDIILSVDIGVADGVTGAGSSINQVQAGFSEFSAPLQFALGDRDQFNAGVVPQSRTINGIDVQLRTPTGNGGLYFDFAANVAGPLGDLSEDTLAAPLGDIFLDLDGLAAGAYSLTTWHHIVIPNPTTNGFDMHLTRGVNPPELIASNVQWTSGTNPGAPASVTFGFEIAAGEDVTVHLESVGNSLTVLSGFQLSAVPEPSSVMALGACLAVLSCVRRRKA